MAKEKKKFCVIAVKFWNPEKNSYYLWFMRREREINMVSYNVRHLGLPPEGVYLTTPFSMLDTVQSFFWMNNVTT